MATIRSITPNTDEHGFEATCVLDNGPLLSHIRLRPLDERKHMGHLGNLGVQIGRCGGGRSPFGHVRGCDRAWAWKRGTARLDEMRCPACGSYLQQTTLALQRTFYVIEPFAVRVIATDALTKARTAAYERMEAYEGDTEHSEEWRELNIRRTKETIEALNGRLKKVQRNPRRKAVAV